VIDATTGEVEITVEHTDEVLRKAATMPCGTVPCETVPCETVPCETVPCNLNLHTVEGAGGLRGHSLSTA
jgi:hypothetical protein